MEENRPKVTHLSELGEFGLIEHLLKNNVTRNKTTIKSAGDDAAVIGSGKKVSVVTTDTLVEGVHFDLLYTPLKHLGYKSVIVNLSDIYAMNAEPKHITVSLAVSNRMSVEALDDFYAGIYLACEMYGVDLIGGDLTSSTSGFIVTITAIGEGEKDNIVYRNGAKESDLICVSGDLGGAYAGLHVLEREKQVFSENEKIQPDFSGKDYVLERQLKPEARKEVIEMLKKASIKPNSMIDISDGLSSELKHICDQSKCGCQIYEEKIPIDAVTIQTAEELNIDPIMAALNGGEDYELLFTVPASMHDQVKELKGISIIGHITDASAGMHLVTKSGQQIALAAQGWNHMQN